MADFFIMISTWALPVLVAITFHEAAHGFVAWRLGDDTAYRLGRVSFNPARHIDPFGTIILPLMLMALRVPFLFGFAKPVPVNFGRLNRPRTDMVLVALAGPGINILLAMAAGLLMRLVVYLPGVAQRWWVLNMDHAIQINLILALFNMLPLPPLDGGRVLVGILPRPMSRAVARVEPFGFLILITLLILLPMAGRQLGQNWDLISDILLPPFNVMYDWILKILVGVSG